MEHDSGFMITGLQAMAVLGAWVVLVLVYGLLRSLGEAPQDPIRPSGPLD